MLQMERLRRDLEDKQLADFLAKNPAYDGPLDLGLVAQYYGMQEEEARQKKASLLADAQRGDVNAARQYAAMQGDLLSATFFLQETYIIHKDGSRSESFWTLDLDFFEQGELAQQGWTPEYVNSVFGGSFDRKFGRLTSISFATEKSPDQVVAKLE
ncbi:MAG TPA: hypothetical protein VIN08_19295, partial [Ohtaekwangia sp.]|uniref:hypothetical protein n=1 Tax=Ohtaekwangia sp. TaxID=2066019 RepID=UPI002F958DCA